MSGWLYKSMLGALAAFLFAGVGLVQSRLNVQRTALGLIAHTDELRGAPPVLSLTTVALGGFRGLISNFLWMRATKLQEENKYFEMVQLADWITKLEPYFPQVWQNEGWNMAFNISVEFTDPADRWRWVQRGMQLLRDEGLKYNPYDVLIHQELGWLFQFKMGGNMDDAQMFYKQEWSQQMEKIFRGIRPNWDELIHPVTEEAKRRADLLRDKYKLDPVLMKELDEKYGPLEWRLPEAHAIYWAVEGLQQAKHNERKVDPNDLIRLWRIVYQSMHLALQRGRLVGVEATNGVMQVLDLGPNFEMIPKANEAYEDALKDQAWRENPSLPIAHRNFLLEAAFLLYLDGRTADAVKWYEYLGRKYPDKPVLMAVPDSLPAKTSLEDFAMGRLEEETQTLGEYKIRAIIESLERRSLLCALVGDDETSLNVDLLARSVYQRYQRKMLNVKNAETRLPIPEPAAIRAQVLQDLLAQLPEDLRALLASKTGQSLAPAPTNQPATNSIGR